MEHYKTLQQITITSNREAMEHFIKAHYLRPDGVDRDLDEYYALEVENHQEIFTLVPEGSIIKMTLIYSLHFELSMVIELDPAKLPGTFSEQYDLIEAFSGELVKEQGNTLADAGVNSRIILYHESY